MAKVRSILSDPRYPALVSRYRHDWTRFSVEMIGKNPTHQQVEILESVQKKGSKTSVSSGHGTGKSDMTSIKILAFMLCQPRAIVAIVANKIDQVRAVIWKYLKENFKALCRRYPWVEQYFVITDTAFYERSHKEAWYASGKSARQGNEEALAGLHAKYLMWCVDEASGVSAKAFGVITGSLTEEDNRILLLSQPTRPSGYFYDTHHSLSISEGGDWNAIILSSEESPLVTAGFIKNKIKEYGGRDNPEYKIKVLGQFPKNGSDWLLSKSDLELATRANPKLSDDWGWVVCADVGNGRDKSIANLMQVSGYRWERCVVSKRIEEMASTIDPIAFGDHLNAEYPEESYPNVIFVVDSDGVGYDTATTLLRHGRRVQRIRWGARMFTESDKVRFYNERAFSNICARDAVLQGRLKIDRSKATIEQASRIPCGLNDVGQWLMMAKRMMKEKLGIKSPDRWDTYCFAFLARYRNAEVLVDDDYVHEQQEADSWMEEQMMIDNAA